MANALRLLNLAPEVLEKVRSGELSAGHARTILGLKNADDMILLAQRAVEEELSVRTLEAEVKRLNKPKKKEIPVEDEKLPFVDYFKELENKIRMHIGRNVKIEEKGKRKSITISYEDNADLDEIISLLCGKEFLENI